MIITINKRSVQRKKGILRNTVNNKELINKTGMS